MIGRIACPGPRSGVPEGRMRVEVTCTAPSPKTANAVLTSPRGRGVFVQYLNAAFRFLFMHGLKAGPLLGERVAEGRVRGGMPENTVTWRPRHSEFKEIRHPRA